MPAEIIFGAIAHMFRGGKLWEALWVYLSWDGYLRQQDCRVLRADDVADDDTNIALNFAPRARGERVKTGSDQGAVIDDPLLTILLRAFQLGVGAGQPFFTIGSTHVEKAWAQALQAQGVDWKPLHCLRHNRPPEEASTNSRPLEGIRRRGRWKQMKSVQRYAKRHALTTVRSQCPKEALARGAAIRANPIPTLIAALRFSKAADSALGRQIHKALLMAKAAKVSTVRSA